MGILLGYCVFEVQIFIASINDLELAFANTSQLDNREYYIGSIEVDFWVIG